MSITIYAFGRTHELDPSFLPGCMADPPSASHTRSQWEETEPDKGQSLAWKRRVDEYLHSKLYNKSIAHTLCMMYLVGQGR